jgi:hypothetical protein
MFRRLRMLGEVEVSIGPVDAKVAAGWCRSALHLLAAVRTNAASMRIDVRPEALDLCQSFVVAWEVSADGCDTFRWSEMVDAEELKVIAEQWLDISSLSVEERDAIGGRAAPVWSSPMRAAVATGVFRALQDIGESGADVVQRMRSMTE